MKRLKILLASLVVLAVSVTGVAVAHADSSFKSGDSVTVPAGQTHDSMLFAAGRSVDIAGTVNGDVLCVGQSVTITGTVNGDVFCAAQSISVTGIVTGSVRAAGQTVDVEGKLGHNLSAAGQSVTIGSAAQVAGDMTVGGQGATIDGSVGRDLFAGATTLTINGTVGRNIEAGVNALTLGEKASVQGNISYTSANELDKASGAQVAGTVQRHQPTKTMREARPRADFGIGHFLFMLVALLLMALAAVLLFPAAFDAAADIAVRKPWQTLGLGFLLSIAMPIAVIVLFVAVIGIPLALVAMLVWLFVWAVSWLFSAYYLGRMLLEKSTNSRIWYMLLGAAIIIVLGFIPLLGFLVWLLAFWLGIGMIAMHVRQLPRPSYTTK